MTLHSVVSTLIFFPPLVNVYAFSCQIRENYRLKTSSGLSPVMIVLRLFAAVCQTMFLYLLNQPAGYKLMIVPQMACIMILVYQQVYYCSDARQRMQVVIGSGVVMVFWAGLIWLGMGDSEYIGNLSGWITVVAGSVVQAPQVYWSWRRKSVYGYSLRYVLFSMAAVSIDFVFAYILDCPVQVYWAYSRVLVYRVVEVYQFMVYPHVLVKKPADDELEEQLYTG